MKHTALFLSIRSTLAASALIVGAFSGSAALAYEPSIDPVVVEIGEMSFGPARITITAGETVRWENVSNATHTVTADPARARNAKSVKLPRGAKPFNSGAIKEGTAFEHKFTVPGLYRYFCIPHERAGMIGEVEVVAAD